MRVTLEDMMDLRHGAPDPADRASQWDVRQVKIALNRLGYYTPDEESGITADIDDDLRAALHVFQSAHGIPMDETPGPDSLSVAILNDELDRLGGNDLYVWRTVGDQKVRDAHAMRNGVRYHWAVPPEGGHPGEDYNCRCWAQPLVPNANPWARWANERQVERRAGKLPVPAIQTNALKHEAAAAAVAPVARFALPAILRAWRGRILENHGYHRPPETLPAFPDAKEVKPIGGRKRWKDSKGKVYEWDYEKGEVEVYGKNKKHKGGFDPKTGKQRSPAVKGRRYKE